MNREEILQYLDFKIVECYLMRDGKGSERAIIRLDIYQDIRLMVFGKQLSQEGIDAHAAKSCGISDKLEGHSDDDNT